MMGFGGDLHHERTDRLPVSEALIADIEDWDRTYQDTFCPDDPLSSGFSTPDRMRDHDEEGRRLAERLKSELGTGFEVSFTPLG